MSKHASNTRVLVIAAALLLGTMCQVNTTIFTVLVSSVASEMVDVRKDMSADQVGWPISLSSLFMIPGVLLSPFLIHSVPIRELAMPLRLMVSAIFITLAFLFVPGLPVGYKKRDERKNAKSDHLHRRDLLAGMPGS